MPTKTPKEILQDLTRGLIPKDIPENCDLAEVLRELAAFLREVQREVLMLSQGQLSFHLAETGPFAGGIKALQANLRHLSWQTQQVANGDFTQRVDFMGEFAAAFNTMVKKLESSREEILRQTEALDRKNRALEELVETQRLTELALRRSEATAHLLLDAPRDAVALLDGSGRILQANATFATDLGRDRDDLPGKVLTELLQGESAARLAHALGESIKSGGPQRYEAQAADRFFDVAVYPIEMTGAPQLAFFRRDITDQKRTQRLRVEGARLETAAIMAAGVAHDINNGMMGLIANLMVLESHITEPEVARKRGENIREAALKAAALATQLLLFAQEGGGTRERIDIGDVLTQVAERRRRFFPPGVGLEVRTEAALPPVLADPAQIAQVLENVLQNAVEAVTGEGTVHAQAEGFCVSESQGPGGEELAPGPYVRISIRDSGHGMDGETLARAGEPFFSTKFLGRGLGLAAATGIVRSHGGRLSIESAVGSGTTVSLSLPGTTAS